MRSTICLAVAILGLGLVSASAQQAVAPKVGQSSLGPVLTDSRGMTLYVYTRDMPGFSNCNAQCVADAPPLLATADAQAGGDWTIITRDDGKKQWAYKSKPVYLWAKDSQAGDVTGEGASKGKWHVSKP
jgi:predicted lipoprotein with Yx(FWY)xxD motif